jgi:putative addiction module component (TIGR02574 family)
MVNVKEILQLSDEEKISLIEMIWESLDDDKSYLTDEQDKELSRRIISFERGETQTYSWEEIESRLKMK